MPTETQSRVIASFAGRKTPFTFGKWALLALPLLAGLGCQPSTTNPLDALQLIEPQLLVERGQLRFVSDAATGCQLAKQQGLPCLLFFTADWCTFCHQMEETAFADPSVGKLAASFVCVLVDADREAQMCQQYAIDGYPTLQFLAADGRSLHRLVGRQSTHQLARGMQAALERLAWLDNAERKRL